MELARYFLELGTTGFGGPIALVGYMERDFVDTRRWVTREEFRDGLAFAQLAPGPLAAQLAIYLGWRAHGARGATIAGVAFVMPSFVMVLLIAIGYVQFGGAPWLAGAFYGIGSAVIAIIARSAIKLARGTVGNDGLRWLVFLVTGIVTAWTERELVWLFVASGVVVMIARARWRPSASAMVWAPLAVQDSAVTGWLGAAAPGMLVTIFAFFASAGMFVFGSGLAIVPYLHGGVVVEHGWLSERQFLDAVAVALVTPGPVVITVSFIGYLVAGVLGAVAASVAVFAPVYFITLLLAPSFERYKHNPQVRAFVDGVTAAATGAIAGAAVVLGRRAITDLATALIALATAGVLLRWRRVPEPLVVLAAGVVGLVVRRFTG
ncbi:MAG: chromate efflux transporter [Gemmatimonadaceae bacterium]|nr:chromate efflux transporter [Gemmatimonadaceae bacterium]